MSVFDLKLAGREEIAADTMAFHFEKPAGFAFKPGQAIDLILPSGAAATQRHAFSIVSAPFERRLSIATRMRDSAFKHALRALPVGAAVQADGPFGLMLPHHARPAVMIAGGIGITPFISMLRQAAQDGAAPRRVLLYSNRRPEDAAFLSELQALDASEAGFRLIATMTQPDKSGTPWQGRTGHIDAELLRAAAAELDAPVYYLAGPPPMVREMQQTLDLVGVDVGNIRSEEFSGY